jgi:hypothetical protein
MTTNIDIALLMSEWDASTGIDETGCPMCGADSSRDHDEMGRVIGQLAHEAGCAMDLALAERGFATQAERDAARQRIRNERQRAERQSAPTLIPPEPPEGA